ncbi:MAG: N-acetylmuramoyl-L-alanine amidase [Anaerolineae bacterium]|nr:N-acetylmuramoyl-L-alanine amidase [Anaerolineae bacterium]
MANILKNLSIIKREAWGATFGPDWPASPAWPPVYHTPQFLVIHHTVTSNQWQPLAAVQAIWRYHAQTQGWGDIRYHYLIGQDGIIYEGRYRGEQPSNIYVEGGQTMTSNTHKLGITLLGQFEPSAAKPPPGEPTPAALDALVWLLAAIAYDMQLDPLGETHHPLENKTYPVISGHRDHYRTSCPGGNLYKLLPAIRQRVAAEVQRLREDEAPEEPEEQADEITILPTETQVAWGKSVWPNLLWGDDDLYVGTWGEAVYYSLIEFGIPEQVRGKKITGLTLSLTGQDNAYLKDADGIFQAVLLAAPLRGPTIATIPFANLRTAAAIAKLTPPLSISDLKPQVENQFTLDPVNLEQVNQAAANDFLAIRLEGPTGGRRLFSWDSGYGQGGLLIKPALTLRYR